MNNSNDKSSRQDHAFAQLLVHAPRASTDEPGPKVSMEELAMLAEGKLNGQRREQVLLQLSEDQSLFETWIGLQAHIHQAEVLERLNTAPTTASTTTASTEQKGNSLKTQISNWMADLFSWQGVVATAFGVFCGVLLSTQSGFNSQDDAALPEAMVIHAPLRAPQKASVDQVNNLLTQFKCLDIESPYINGLCASLTASNQHWFYLDKNNILQPISAPASFENILDIRMDQGKIIVESGGIETGKKLSIIRYQAQLNSHDDLIKLFIQE